MDQLVHAFLPASRFATRISHLKSLLPSLSSSSIAIHCSYDSRNIHCPISRLDSHRLLRISTNPISTTQSQNLFLPPQWTVFLFPSSASSVVWSTHTSSVVSISDYDQVPTRTLATAKLSALPSASPVPLSLQYGPCFRLQRSSILTRIQVVCWPASLFCGCCATETGKK